MGPHRLLCGVAWAMRAALPCAVLAVAALLTLGTGCARGGEEREITGIVTVIDGDTIEVDGSRVRLFGIDAPETGQLCRRVGKGGWPCGQYATVALDRLAGGKRAKCRVQATDAYDRAVAVCTVGREDLGGAQVREGWAVAYRHYSSRYVDGETAARQANRGIWQGEFDLPWNWRERHRRR